MERRRNWDREGGPGVREQELGHGAEVGRGQQEETKAEQLADAREEAEQVSILNEAEHLRKVNFG